MSIADNSVTTGGTKYDHMVVQTLTTSGQNRNHQWSMVYVVPLIICTNGGTIKAKVRTNLILSTEVSELTSSLQLKVKANLGPDLSLRLISGDHSAMYLELTFKWKYCNQLKLANCIRVLSMIEHDKRPAFPSWEVGAQKTGAHPLNWIPACSGQ
ncbi:hypothetical protein C8J56DRAFT_885859 [Mycena floridula]|nr:hypothetical protein C8J56DRAFT_885859 [Mycena floridula]